MMSIKFVRTINIFILLVVATAAFAQRISVQCPAQVQNGEQFYLRYVVNTTDVRDFRIGSVPDAFEVLMGPSTSTQQSFSIVGGKTTHSSSVTYTYVLMATKNGSFVIPAAHAIVEGKNANSSAHKISVSGTAPSGGNARGGAPQSQQQPAHRVDRAGTRISGNDLFIRVSANKKRVHEQEPILLTYKVYTQVELTQLEGKMPDLNGFHTQEIPLPQQKRFHTERVDGKIYNCVTWSQYVMYPQMSGKLEIPALTFKGIVVQENPNVDPFEAFFNGGAGYIEVKKDITAPKVEIQVDPLPAKPANFSGGVGHFAVQASVDKTDVRAGDPVNLRFVVSGTGNMKLLKEPELELPKDFEKYDAKVTDKTKLSADGISGSMIYDILIVPRNKGKYTIPAIEYVYYDLATQAYKTLKTQPIELNVAEGNGGKGTVADYSQRSDNDIHDFSKGLTDATEDGNNGFFGGTSYYVIHSLIALLFVILSWVFRKRAIALSDITAMRAGKANKVATKRLRKADKLMKEGKVNEFYDEVMRALWGFIGDKFGMNAEELTRDNVTEKLTSKGVGDDIIKDLIGALDDCEFARYAPGDTTGSMQNTYDKALSILNKVTRL